MSISSLFVENNYDLYCNSINAKNGFKGTVIINNTSDTTSSSTGALIVEGGAYIDKNLIVHGDIYGDNITALSTDNSTSASTGSVVIAGGLGIAKDLYVGGNLTVNGSITPQTTSFSTTLAGAHSSPLSSTTVYMTKISNTVTLHYSVANSSNATGSSYSMTFGTKIPSGYYNTNRSVSVPCMILNNNIVSPAVFSTSIDGSVVITSASYITGTAGIATGGLCVTYYI